MGGLFSIVIPTLVTASFDGPKFQWCFIIFIPYIRHGQEARRRRRPSARKPRRGPSLPGSPEPDERMTISWMS